MHITVAICTWNRAPLLTRTLEQMTRLEVPDTITWDLLVVNNNSTDATSVVIASFADLLPIREHFEARPGLSHSRNRALDEARGDYILWTDDDVLVDTRWLTAFVATARRHPEGSIFGGPIEPWFSVAPDPVILQAFPALRHGFCGVDHQTTEGPLAPRQYVWGANMAFRRAAIDGLRFNTALGVGPRCFKVGEEKDFINRVRHRGGSVIWSPEMRVRHYIDPARMTCGYLTRFYVGSGQTWIREEGVPEGARWFGAPRWLWRKCLESSARVAFHSLTSARREALIGRRDFAFWRGAIEECRAVTRERRAAGSTAP
jgi:glycosyltransferase involved in cell wall biosynthesis